MIRGTLVWLLLLGLSRVLSAQSAQVNPTVLTKPSDYLQTKVVVKEDETSDQEVLMGLDDEHQFGEIVQIFTEQTINIPATSTPPTVTPTRNRIDTRTTATRSTKAGSRKVKHRKTRVPRLKTKKRLRGATKCYHF